MGYRPKGVDRSLEQPAPHVCELPAIREFGPPRGKGRYAVPTVRTVYREGTRYHCSCEKVWIVWNKPPVRNGFCYMTGGLSWREEEPRERRERLGTTWWQESRAVGKMLALAILAAAVVGLWALVEAIIVAVAR